MQTIGERALVEGWQHLGTTEPHGCLEAWRQLHWASQLVARVAQTFLPSTEDDSHPNMEWNRDRRSLSGRVIPAGAVSVAVSFSLADLTLSLRQEDGTTLAKQPLTGIGLGEAERWLGETIAEYTNGQIGPSLGTQIYELPNHPVADGAPFDPPGPSHEEITKWIGNAALVLEEVRSWRGGTEVRLWPHHFDIATLIPVDGTRGTSIGVGLAPADGSIAETYWYVNSWPQPEEQSHLPALAGKGQWQTKGWFGAVLSASDTRASSVDSEVTGLVDFLNSAIREIEGLLDRSGSDR